MTWNDEIQRFKIRKMYQNASFDNAELLPEKLVEFGRQWVATKKKPSLFLHGNPGSGKTYFSICLLRHLIESGVRYIYYIRSDDLERELLDASLGNLFNTNGYKISERTLLDRYCECDYLFIDDLGTERDTDRVKKQYTNIIDERVGNHLVSIFTSNLDLPQIGMVLGERFESRLKFSRPIKFRDEDLRAKIASQSMEW